MIEQRFHLHKVEKALTDETYLCDNAGCLGSREDLIEVVVLDPADEAQMTRLAKAIFNTNGTDLATVNRVKESVQSLRVPSEPKATGSKIQDYQNRIWTRVAGATDTPWHWANSYSSWQNLVSAYGPLTEV